MPDRTSFLSLGAANATHLALIQIKALVELLLREFWYFWIFPLVAWRAGRLPPRATCFSRYSPFTGFQVAISKTFHSFHIHRFSAVFARELLPAPFKTVKLSPWSTSDSSFCSSIRAKSRKLSRHWRALCTYESHGKDTFRSFRRNQCCKQRDPGKFCRYPLDWPTCRRVTPGRYSNALAATCGPASW